MPIRADDPYLVLGVAPEADATQIRRAYLALMRLHHPDRRGGDHDATAATSRINAAYAQLRDPARRAVLDRLRAPEKGRQAGGGTVRAAPSVAAAPPAYSQERVDFGRNFQRASLRVGVGLLLVGLVLLLLLGR